MALFRRAEVFFVAPDAFCVRPADALPALEAEWAKIVGDGSPQSINPLVSGVCLNYVCLNLRPDLVEQAIVLIPLKCSALPVIGRNRDSSFKQIRPICGKLGKLHEEEECLSPNI